MAVPPPRLWTGRNVLPRRFEPVTAAVGTAAAAAPASPRAAMVDDASTATGQGQPLPRHDRDCAFDVVITTTTTTTTPTATTTTTRTETQRRVPLFTGADDEMIGRATAVAPAPAVAGHLTMQFPAAAAYLDQVQSQGRNPLGDSAVDARDLHFSPVFVPFICAVVGRHHARSAQLRAAVQGESPALWEEARSSYVALFAAQHIRIDTLTWETLDGQPYLDQPEQERVLYPAGAQQHNWEDLMRALATAAMFTQGFRARVLGTCRR